MKSDIDSFKDIVALKSWLQNAINPLPEQPPVGPMQAWTCFKTALSCCLEEEYCEELAFSISEAANQDGKIVPDDKPLFQIYFSRLMDVKTRSGMRVAEVALYYRYPMNDQLCRLLNETPKPEMEIAYFSTDPEASIRQKIEMLADFADGMQGMWKAVEGLEPALADFHFWIW
ncbi:MAG TPA: hypothetical protein PKW33_05490 [Anaerolineaceae bacterium]|nr:hypothetical protein [Anaerolineaceae bacterium]HPN51019.1 hypothetical protein [Anaerolineaceae bacterium]